ncbi:hypothetical protein DL546_004543 [Coniochaeta pulveracea]|uniref:Conserved oligomeric Golgi complex subunit 5 n=1 Tax=Coniochaeta pulveracea TaxID=177199 RepID=A0A420Y0D7_9PEZI|nr:hypothetical protein DL546_004543 [Coniochaeta pulveracea]
MTSRQSEEEASYIDYETFLSPTFSPSQFANTLVLATNNPSDHPLDLSTPLSRVLFDIQEIDSHIDLLTTRSAIPLLTHTESQTASSTRIVTSIESQVQALNESYKQLEKEVIQKHAEAEEVQQVASRLWETLRLGRTVGRCLQLGRQLEIQHAEVTGATSIGSTRKEDHRALVRTTQTLLSLREIFSGIRIPSSEGYGLDRVTTIRTLQSDIIAPIERSVREISERIIREFSPGSSTSSTTFSQAEETRSRTISALTTLYLLSHNPKPAPTKEEKIIPHLMLEALESHLRSALQSSVAGLARGLAALPSLDRALAEVSSRCQNIVALEAILDSTAAPQLPGAVTPAGKGGNLLQPLLAHLETGSLASYFWRTLAGGLSSRVQEIMNRGGKPHGGWTGE